MSGVTRKVGDITRAQQARRLELQRARRASEKAARPPRPAPTHEQNCARARKAAKTKRANAAAATDTRTANSRARGTAPGPSISPWRGRAKDMPKPAPILDSPLSARVVVLSATGDLLAEADGIEGALARSRGFADSAAILGVDDQGKPTALLARPAHGLATVSFEVANGACERWRALQQTPRSPAAPPPDMVLGGAPASSPEAPSAAGERGTTAPAPSARRAPPPQTPRSSVPSAGMVPAARSRRRARDSPAPVGLATRRAAV